MGANEIEANETWHWQLKALLPESSLLESLLPESLFIKQAT
ncbi:MAG: hypothetical protein AAF171_21575 [Cyanobacteria bacterium P01_A01_bin.116]